MSLLHGLEISCEILDKDLIIHVNHLPAMIEYEV